jgi:hypothetical protein
MSEVYKIFKFKSTWHTPWQNTKQARRVRVFIEKRIVAQLANKFPTVCGTRSFTYCLHVSPQRVLILRQINPLPLPVTIFIWFILILYSHVCPRLARSLFPSDFLALLQSLTYNLYISLLLFPVSPTHLVPNFVSVFRCVGGSKENIKFGRVPLLN